jgi:hypothetical protein
MSGAAPLAVELMVAPDQVADRDGYAAIARQAGAGLMLESATWRVDALWN